MPLEWIPSNVEISGDERANQKAKQGAISSQPDVLLTFRRAKSIISAFIDKYNAVTENPRALRDHEEPLLL
ncbi:hypothetical protein TNCV_3254421 [Trichonephila clavipes]|nr:hypothetical protein TNCV_3254421 [Trichonephila clavipes]